MKPIPWMIWVWTLSFFPTVAFGNEIVRSTAEQTQTAAPVISEIREDTHTRVIVRNHPKTGRPYVSIVDDASAIPEDPFANLKKRYQRPDYRMLDPNVKSGKIPYDGPYSDRKKVYVFAASLATLGVAGGAIGMTAVTSTAAASASGGTAYLAAGSAVAAGTTAAAYQVTKSNPKEDNFTLESRSRLIEPAPAGEAGNKD